MKFCVVGAGIIGMSCAVRLKKAFPDTEIFVISENFSPDTTSDGSGGFWQPHLIGGTPPALVSTWSRETFKLCENLWRGTFLKDLEGLEKMAQAISLVHCFDLKDVNAGMSDHDDSGPWKSIVYDYKWMNEQDTSCLGLPGKM